jgi:hypothetical protein
VLEAITSTRVATDQATTTVSDFQQAPCQGSVRFVATTQVVALVDGFGVDGVLLHETDLAMSRIQATQIG